jgi:hypothetical protein
LPLDRIVILNCAMRVYQIIDYERHNTNE